MTQASVETLVSAKGVKAGYGKKQVLAGIDLTVRSGETVGLLGPNGSGKTTLLKVLCGALDPWSGHIKLQSQPIKGLSAKKRALLSAYVPQQEDHAFDFTVQELTLMGRFSHSDGLFETQEDIDSAKSAMLAADCLEFANRPLSTLSGGEAQRALVARALAQEAPVLLCDEPTAHLDPHHQVSVARLLKKLGGEGRAIVVATHDLNMAAMCCDRVVLLMDGQIAFDGMLADAIGSGTLERVFGTPFYESEGYVWASR